MWALWHRRPCHAEEMVLVSNGSWIVNLLIVAAMLVIIAMLARSFWLTARRPDDRPRDGDDRDGRDGQPDR